MIPKIALLLLFVIWLAEAILGNFVASRDILLAVTGVTAAINLLVVIVLDTQY